MMDPVDTSGTKPSGSFSNHDMAIGLEYVRRNDLTAARSMLDTLRKRNATGKSAASSTSSRYRQSDIEAGPVMEQMLEASIQFATGDRDVALKKVVAAAEAEDKLIFEYGPPAIVKPAWEQAGEMLLAAGKKKEAADAFRKALKRYPNRKLSNEGLKTANTP